MGKYPVSPTAVKATASNPSDNCVFLDAQEDGTIEISSDTHPGKIIASVEEIEALLEGARNGEFAGVVAKAKANLANVAVSA